MKIFFCYLCVIRSKALCIILHFYCSFTSLWEKPYKNVAESIIIICLWQTVHRKHHAQRRIINFDYIDDALEKFPYRFEIKNIHQTFFSFSFSSKYPKK